MLLIPIMKRISIRKLHAPSPRYTLWVPALLAFALCLIWLVLIAVFQR